MLNAEPNAANQLPGSQADHSPAGSDVAGGAMCGPDEMCGLPVDDWRARLFTPKIVLILLTVINLLNYTDRYLISGE